MKTKNPKRSPRRSSDEEIDLEKILSGAILYDNVLVKPRVIDKVGDVVRPQQYEDKPEFGEVLMVGEGRIFDNGIVVPLRVKVGQIVYFQKFSSQKLRIGGIDYLILREEDIYWNDNL